MKNLILFLIFPILITLASCASVKEYTEEIPAEYLEERYFEDLVAGQCDAECNSPATRSGEIWCNTTKACKALNCGCRLFRISKANPEKWEKLPTKKQEYEPKKYLYKCWCVK